MAMNWTVKVRPGIWTDPRFRLLERRSTDRWQAIGKLVEFWQLAQGYWAVGENIPETSFKFLDMPEIVECGFAVQSDDGSYRARGDEEHFQWLKAQRERSEKGVLARRAKKNPKSTPSQPQVNRTVTHELEQEQELELRKEEVLRTFVETRVSPGDGNSEPKIFFAPNSEISDSEPYVTASIALNASNSAAVERLHTDPCRDSRPEEKSNSVAVEPVKNDLPEDHGSKQKIPPVSELARVWNENRGPLPKVLKVTGDRERKAKVRLREEPDLEQWKDAIVKLANWDWGTGHNSSGWMADFDYLLRPGTMVKALEGFFDAKTPKQKKKDDGISDEFIEQLARKYGNA